MTKLSLLDYPGMVSCILFMPCCNMACPFCHNSELLHSDPPQAYIRTSDVIDYLEKRKGIIDGVVITGGEPSLHNLDSLLAKIQSLGYKIKIDTNGLNPEAIQHWIDIGVVDYIAMDIKNSEERYGETCGNSDVDMRSIIESIGIIMNSHIDYEFRTTVVSPLHTPQRIHDIVRYLIPGADRYFLQPFVMRDTVPDKTLTEPSDELMLACFEETCGFVKYSAIRGRDISPKQ